jgi:hypothetical protein
VSVRLKVLAVVLVAALALSACGGGGSTSDVNNPTAEAVKTDVSRTAELQAEKSALEAKAKVRAKRAQSEKSKELPSVTGGGTNGTPGQKPPAQSGSANLESSFAALQSEVEGEIGIAFAPLGGDEIQEYGGTAVDHAWSSFKVPIVVTLMAEEGGHLSAEQESLAASAITASDNAAAASLFSDLEAATGGNAAGTIEGSLRQLRQGATDVATAPPPPGAYSSWGQTNWTLTAATAFYRAVACGELGEVSNVEADMENVIPEQQWGLGQASFPEGTRVAFKAGWGPDASESGPYLVRQSGILRSGNTGAVVTIAAQASSGSFEAGVSDLDQVADWVAENIDLQAGSCL